jgi:hypothetical protein
LEVQEEVEVLQHAGDACLAPQAEKNRFDQFEELIMFTVPDF